MTYALPELAGPIAAREAVVLAQQPGNGDNGGQGEDFGKSSPVGLLVLLLFLVAVVLLVRSMTKHLKRVPATFDKPADGEPGTPGEDVDEDAKPGDR